MSTRNPGTSPATPSALRPGPGDDVDAAQALAEARAARARAEDALARLARAEEALREATGDAPSTADAPVASAPTDANAPAGPSAGLSIPLGAALTDGTPTPDAQVHLPLRTLNRHVLVAGATGTGKTRTLQLMAEGLSQAGVPVFLTDVKGDLTGLVSPSTPDDAARARAAAVGQQLAPAGFPVEFLALGSGAPGTPVRTTVTDLGPLLLAKVLGLNDTQESALALVFHWADTHGLALLDLADLRAVLLFLTGEGTQELRGIGGISSATAGVILREVSALEAQGAAEFFGEPAFAVTDLLRTAADGRGVISSLVVPDLADRPALFSAFVMWLLAELFEELPEVGDPERPRLVFFFDEAHLLVKGASEAFLDQVVRTVRLIRSKGVGVVLVTQSPTDLPDAVLAQLGGRVQHALRAHTPKDADALRKVARTFPTSPGVDVAAVLPALGTGEALVSVLAEDGTPTPVVAARLRVPASSMSPAPGPEVAATVAASALRERYAQPVDRESALEILTTRAAATPRSSEATGNVEADEEHRRREQELRELQEHLDRENREVSGGRPSARRTSRDAGGARTSMTGNAAVDAFLTSAGRTLGREITRSLFGTRRRRR